MRRVQPYRVAQVTLLVVTVSFAAACTAGAVVVGDDCPSVRTTGTVIGSGHGSFTLGSESHDAALESTSDGRPRSANGCAVRIDLLNIDVPAIGAIHSAAAITCAEDPIAGPLVTTSVDLDDLRRTAVGSYEPSDLFPYFAFTPTCSAGSTCTPCETELAGAKITVVVEKAVGGPMGALGVTPDFERVVHVTLDAVGATHTTVSGGRSCDGGTITSGDVRFVQTASDYAREIPDARWDAVCGR